jgi:hypothetical protein
MNSDLTRDFNELLEVEEINLNRQVAQNMRATERIANAEGRLLSGTTMSLLVKDAANAIPIYAQLLLALAARVSTAHGLAIDRQSLDVFRELVRYPLAEELRKLIVMVVDTAPFQGNDRIVGQARDHLLQELALLENAELQRITAELRLIATANDRRALDSAKSVDTIVFNGSVGVVQTGPGSMAYASQTFDAATRNALTDALDRLLADLNGHSEEFPFNRGEVKELLIEAQTESKKPSPNMTRLRSLVSGIGNTIAFAPKLKDAYDTLKWAGTFLGVTLP